MELKDAFNNDLTQGDSARLLRDLTIGGHSLPAGTILKGLWIFSQTQAEFRDVPLGGRLETIVVPGRDLEKV
jgi:uncharacterized Zn ribbon protein